MNILPSVNSQAALAYDHVGIRVSNRQNSVHFYERLGFKETYRISEGEANEMVTPAGVRINLIFNGAKIKKTKKNTLLDEAIKKNRELHILHSLLIT